MFLAEQPGLSCLWDLVGNENCFFQAKIHTILLIHFSLRVRGQHTKTTGRRGRTVGVAKKK